MFIKTLKVNTFKVLLVCFFLNQTAKAMIYESRLPFELFKEICNYLTLKDLKNVCTLNKFINNELKYLFFNKYTSEIFKEDIFIENFDANHIKLRDKNKRTLLHYAAGKNYPEVPEKLIRLGADINAQDKDGLTPLHYAARNNALDAMSVLIESDVNLNAVNKNLTTPLSIAIQHGHYGFAEFLIHHGCDTNIQDVHGMTSLDYFLDKNDSEQDELLAVLIEKIDMRAELRRTMTSLHSAIHADNLEGVKMLLASNKIDVNTPTQRGALPIHWSARSGDLAIFELLVQAGVDCCALSGDRNMPLHEVCFAGHYDLLEALMMQTGVVGQINAKNIFGETPLHLAVKGNNKQVAEYLLKQEEIDVSLTDSRNQTPYDVARERGFYEVAELFKEHLDSGYEHIALACLSMSSIQELGYDLSDEQKKFLSIKEVNNAILLVSSPHDLIAHFDDAQYVATESKQYNLLLYNNVDYEYCRSCVHAIAATALCNFVEIDCALVEFADDIQQAFLQVSLQSPCIVFISNMVALAPSDRKKIQRKLLLPLAKGIDNLNKKTTSNLSVVVAAVNQLEDIYKPLLVKFSSLDMNSITR